MRRRRFLAFDRLESLVPLDATAGQIAVPLDGDCGGVCVTFGPVDVFPTSPAPPPDPALFGPGAPLPYQPVSPF